jgi:site-specific DNA recombinase
MLRASRDITLWNAGERMMRAVIYARYSTDMQRQASIDDQSEICRRYIERQGWTLVGRYADPATSGSSAFRRGFQRLRADAGDRAFRCRCV